MSRRPPRRTPVPAARPCPCGLTSSYEQCCGRFHRGSADPTTAEQLMRSRYSAYVVGNAAYLLRTWSGDTRPPRLEFDARLRWTGLDVLGVTGGSAFHTEGTVEFRADYVVDPRRGQLHENSRFLRDDGRWVYHDALA